MPVITQCGPFGYAAMAAGLALLIAAVVLIRRGAGRLTLFRLAIWCLLPVLIGYFGTFSRQRMLAATRTDKPYILPDAAAREARVSWYSTHVGVCSAVPPMMVALGGLYAARGKKDPAKPTDRPQEH